MKVRFNSSGISVLSAIVVFLAAISAEGKVLELSERFIPLRNEGMWLIKVLV